MKRLRTGLLLLLLSYLLLCSACSSDPPEKTPEPVESNFGYVNEVTPLADGGAYAFTDGSIWYLKGGEAIKVRKVEKLSNQPVSQSTFSLNTKPEKGLWALWRSEAAKRKHLLELEPSDDPSETYDPF